MTTVPPFTLVHKPSSASGSGGSRPEELGLMRVISREASDLATALEAVRPLALRRTLLCTAVPDTAGAGSGLAASSIELLERLVGDLGRQDRVTTVGIWDVNARVGRLPAIIERINEAQPAFTFYEIQAAVPAGLISRPERVAAWASERMGRQLEQSQREQMALNVIAEDFFERAEAIRNDLGVDYLAGVIRSMVAGEDDSEVYWNHFATFEGRTLLVSALDLREFARQAGRPFEVGVLFLVLAELLVAIHWPRLGFHDDTGCLFDYNAERRTIVRGFREPRIDRACRKRIDPEYRAAAETVLRVLREYRSPSPESGDDA